MKKFSVCSAACLAVLSAAIVSPADARPDAPLFTWQVTLTSPAVAPFPNDAHLVFSGTGGSIKNADYTSGPAITSIAGTSNRVDLVWDDKLPASSVSTFTFTTAFSPIEFAGGDWTNDGDIQGQISQASVRLVPSPGAGALLLAAVIGIRRRR